MKLPALILAAFCLILAGCGQSVLVGKFRTPTGETIEFVSGGTFLLQNNQSTVTGHWETLADARITLRFDGLQALAGAIVCPFKADGDDIVFSDCRLAGRLKRIS